MCSGMPEIHLSVQGDVASNALAAGLERAFSIAINGETKLPEPLFHVQGYSGRKFRIFLNGLFEIVEQPRYLEIGVFNGGSFVPAIYGNRMKATALDNWSWEGADINRFKDYIDKFGGIADVTIIDKDFRAVDYSAIGPFNVMFYDGSHAEKDQLDGVRLPAVAMDRSHIVIVDDWNFDRVRRGTFAGLEQAGCRIDHMIELRTSLDGSLPTVRGPKSEWHNGMFAAAVARA